MATRYVLQFARLPTEPVLSGTDQPPGKIYYLAQPGVTPPAAGSAFAPQRNGLVRYVGNLSALGTDCAQGTTPPVMVGGSPSWPVGFSLMPALDSSDYSVSVSITTPIAYAGQTITGISAANLPTWLRTTPGEGKIMLIGSVPAGTGSFTLTLIARQSDGKSTPIDLTVSVASAEVRLYTRYDQKTRTLSLLVGGNGSGNPTAQLIDSPASYPDRDIVGLFKLPASVTLESLPYYFQADYTNLTTGHYAGRIVWLGKTLYFSRDIVAEKDRVLAHVLSSSAPAGPVDSGPVQDAGEVAMAAVPTVLTKLDYAWQKNSPPSSLSNVDFWFGSNDNSALEYALSVSGGDTVPKGNYLSTTAGNFGTGYSRKDSIANASTSLIFTLYIRKVGTTTDLQRITLPAFPASGSIARTTVFSNS